MTLSRYWSIIGIICESEKRSLNPANETVLSWSLVIDIRVEPVVSCLMNFNNHNNNNYYDGCILNKRPSSRATVTAVIRIISL